MCGRYNVEPNLRAWLDAFEILGQIDRERDYRARYNIAPRSIVPVIREFEGRPVVSLMRWHFVPAWIKEDKPLMMNCARAETISTSGYFKRAFAGRRCIVPASGFYEWHTPTGGAKQPFNIRPVDGSPLLMAGIWDSWRGQDNFAIITIDPNEVMAPIHERMPVIIPRNEMLDWLVTDTPVNYLHPAPDDFLTAYPVSTAVNGVRNDTPELIFPLAGVIK